MNSNNNWNGIFVFMEIKDHERVLDGSLEILTKARELKERLSEPIYAVVFAQNVEQYLPSIEIYGPDYILYSNSEDKTLKHFHGEIFTDMWESLIRKYLPSIVLFPATEAGLELSARLAARFETGLTAHCSDLEIIDHPDYGTNLLLMKRPAFSGNMMASIICPENRPQMASIQQGIFEKKPLSKDDLIKSKIRKVEVSCNYSLSNVKVINVQEPKRWNQPEISLEQSDVIIAGGNGLASKENFLKLYELADVLNGEVGATRIPVFKDWCQEDRMIGETGKIVSPDVYLAFGISGQVHHTYGMIKSRRIFSINIDPDAIMNELADYIIIEDAPTFLEKLIERLKTEIKKKGE